MKHDEFRSDRIAAWIFGILIVVLVTAQFWTKWLDRAFPLAFSPTPIEQRIWQRNCGGNVSHDQWIERGC
jgi:hypothetical protein